MYNMTTKKPNMPSKNKDKKAPMPKPVRGSRTAKNKANKKKY